MKKMFSFFSLLMLLNLGACVFEQDGDSSDPGEGDPMNIAAPVLQSVQHGDDILTLAWKDGNTHIFEPSGNLLRPINYRVKIVTTGDTCSNFRGWVEGLACDVSLPNPSQATQYVYEIVGRYEGNKYGKAKRDSLTLYPQPIWTLRTSGATRMRSVVGNGSLLVAVGDSGIVLTSPDGANWTLKATGTKLNLRAVTWHDNRFIAVGDSGVILVSSNGATWSSENSGTNSMLHSVAGGAGKVIAVGDAGVVLTSSGNGSWSSQQLTSQNLHVVFWADENFVAGGNKAFFSSGDGTGWSPSSTIAHWQPAVTVFGFAVGASKLVAVGSRVRCDLPKSCAGELSPYYPFGFATSSARPDSLPAGRGQQLDRVKADLRAIAWNGNEFLAVGGGYQASSRDGVWWSTKNEVPDLHAVVWTGTRWVGAGATGVYTSP